MTHTRRRAHLLLWLILAPLALAGLVLAVVWRPAEPVQDGPLPGATAHDDTPIEQGDSP